MQQKQSHTLKKLPEIKTQMLIRRPVSDVFQAFIDPTITTKFWFTKSSGRVEPEAELIWEWEMYNVSTNIKVEKVEKNKRITIRWNIDSDISNPSIVEWQFFPQKNDTTFVTITNKKFQGDTDEVVAEAIASMGGFSFLLGAAKAWLEHGIELNLVLDHAPADLKLK